jgi:hypothetical protein
VIVESCEFAHKSKPEIKLISGRTNEGHGVRAEMNEKSMSPKTVFALSRTTSSQFEPKTNFKTKGIENGRENGNWPDFSLP